MHFIFAKKSDTSSSKVRWFRLRQDVSEAIQVSPNMSSRYETSIRRIHCPEYLAVSINTLCQIASFSFNEAFFGDIGDYTAQVEGEDCSPCSANFSINVNPKPTVPGEEEITDPPGDSYDLPMSFFNPPFALHFNTNSTVCSGQRFQFICYPLPHNFGTNLSLLRVDPIFTDSKLRYMSSRESALDFRDTNTHHVYNLLTSEADREPLIYNLDSVNKSDSGGYVCVGSLAYDDAARWMYMYLNVIDCDHIIGKPLRERIMEVFASPTALTFICLLTAILLIILATLIVFTCRHQLPIFLTGTKKLSSTTKIVMEANRLYPWASPPHHNCSHPQSIDAVKTTSASGYYGNTPGVGRSLQVPAVIIQVDNSATNTPGNGHNAGNNNGGGAGCESKPNTYKIPNDPTWEVERDCVRLGRQIGAGAFGVVYAGVVVEPNRVLPGLRRRDPNDRPDVQELTVAVKTLRDNFNEQELADLVREMEILKQFDPHPHVIQLYGACTQNGAEFCIRGYGPRIERILMLAVFLA
ncbi:unnamed protein product [Hymenolepis diminuta]|uniref:Protein kinase domain-containing protein n=1 Tax=Hymenolepis diminuta TaxID=6216 RepID=A0A0R3S8Q1_HYMDI|nr:unnamed protein product [Hymenolepis diminuta]